MNKTLSPKFKDLFNYEYKGGGYFRLKGIPKNKVAPILHGEEAILYLYKKMLVFFNSKIND